MQKLLEPEAIELEPEAQAAVDEVCEAVSDPWGAPTGLGERFKFALYQAAKYGNPECRERIFAAVETAVREDPELWIRGFGNYTGKEVSMAVRILCGDVREQLQALEDQSVQCVVTSPPY